MRYLIYLSALAFCASPVVSEDWPHWRGASRDGRSAESSRFDDGAWPPRPLWGREVGVGSSSVVVAGGQLFALGHEAGREVVHCLDVKDGSTRWTQRYAAPIYGRHARGDQGFYKGPSSTPEFDTETGRLYTLGIDGDLRCWDTRRDGDLVWALNLYDEFAIPQRPQVTDRPRSHRDYGCPTSPLVAGDRLLVEAGDPQRGNVLCFDKAGGELLWGSENKDPAGHTGAPSLMEVEGVPCLAVLTARNLVVMRLDATGAGKTVAQYPWTTDFINNIPCPVVVGESVLVTSRYNIGKMAKLDITLRGGAKLDWENDYPSGVCTPVVHDGRIYFANKGFHCVDLESGRLLWEGGRYGDPGSVVLTADGRLIAWANDGDLSLVESAARSPSKYLELANKRRVLDDMAWPHVVLSGGMLFCKDRGGRVRCLALEAGPEPAAARREPKPVAKSNPDPGRIAPRSFELRAWPGESRHLLLAWKRGAGKRGLLGRLPRGGRYSLSARGGAVFADDGAVRTAGGSFVLGGDVARLRGELVKGGELSIELVFRSDDLDQAGPARILSYSESAYARNFTLAQEGEQLLLRLRTTQTGDNGMKPEVKLGRIEAGVPYHLVVTYRDGELNAYLNGAMLHQTGAVRGGFDNWADHSFVIGDEADGERNWHGTVDGFAIFDRAMDAGSAAKRLRAIAR